MTAFSNKIITYVASCALDFGPSFSRSCIFRRPTAITAAAATAATNIPVVAWQNIIITSYKAVRSSRFVCLYVCMFVSTCTGAWRLRLPYVLRVTF